MSYKIKSIAKSISLLFSIFFLLNASSVFAATLYANPSSIDNPSLTVGSNITVDVKIDNVINLYGFDFKLYWNKSILEFVSSTAHPENLWFGFTRWYDKVNNSYYQAAYSTGNPAMSFTGSSSLATIKFKVIGIGSTNLSIQDAKLGDGWANKISYYVKDGSFNNQPVCTCGSWVKTNCESDGTCTTCYWSRKCSPSGCSQTTRTTRACA